MVRESRRWIGVCAAPMAFFMLCAALMQTATARNASEKLWEQPLFKGYVPALTPNARNPIAEISVKGLQLSDMVWIADKTIILKCSATFSQPEGASLQSLKTPAYGKYYSVNPVDQSVELLNDAQSDETKVILDELLKVSVTNTLIEAPRNVADIVVKSQNLKLDLPIKVTASERGFRPVGYDGKPLPFSLRGFMRFDFGKDIQFFVALTAGDSPQEIVSRRINTMWHLSPDGRFVIYKGYLISLEEPGQPERDCFVYNMRTAMNGGRPASGCSFDLEKINHFKNVRLFLGEDLACPSPDWSKIAYFNGMKNKIIVTEFKLYDKQ